SRSSRLALKGVKRTTPPQPRRCNLHRRRAMKISRREIIAGTGASLATVSLTSSMPSAQARRVFVIATNADLSSFDPHAAGGYLTTMLIRNVYGSLLRAEDNPPKAVPNLAESWTVSPDGL